jgi:hypothetical protein
VIERIFPGGIPMERVENLTPFYAKEGKGFLQKVAERIHPLHAEAILIVEKEA